ncbi:hypothetical protein ACQJBY_008301 [Aegilops geniculata]
MDGESSRCNIQENILLDEITRPRKLPFQYLEEITNNFSTERELGRGAYGVVYKGVLKNEELMAVKRLMVLMPGSEKQFENEVYHLMRLNHPNIVRCVGYCYETQNLCLKYDGKYIFAETAERLLCMEYMPKGNLDNHLADELHGLDWHERYNIINGICYGLHYLHEEWEVNTPIIHMDLKPANILLGDDMLPKIADFGLSRLFSKQQTQVCTRSRDGTYGYMAPEYINQGIITTKSDIFSLGVIIIQIITGYRNYPSPVDTELSYHDFVELVLKKWRKRLEAVSCNTSSLETDYQQIKSCLDMGLSCLETDPTKRPSTTEITKRLIKRGSTNFHVGGDERPPTLKKIMTDPREFLLINPSELQFCLELNKRNRCLVHLTNNTNEHVAFSFGATSTMNNYSIEPSSAFICPWSTFTVFVTMEELRELPSHMQCNDEFLVKTIVVRGSRLTSKHITDGSLNMSSSVVHKAKLTVAYVLPAQPPSLLNVRSEEIKASDPHRLERFFNFVPQDKQNEGILIRFICQNLGFSNGGPIAACIVYRLLLHWKSFGAVHTNVFSGIITSMRSRIKAQDNDMSAYWLSNSLTLLLLTERTLKTATEDRFIPRRGIVTAKVFGSVFRRNQAAAGSHLIGGNGGLQKVRAKRPALLFKRNLRGFIEKVYGMIRDNLVKEISPLLGCCIKAPTILCQALFDHWQSIVNILTDYSSVLKDNHVPSFLISKMFTRVFSFIDVRLFNNLLLSECCSFSDGEYIKAGLAKLEQWCIYETDQYAGSSWEKLKHIREAAIFLTMRDKQKKTLEEITCHVLTKPQLYRICTLYRDDRYGTNDVSPLTDMLRSMECAMGEDGWYVILN